MLLILDANEYIFAFGPFKEEAPKFLLDAMLATYPMHILRISRTIVEEVREHLSPETLQEFIKLVLNLTSIDDDSLIPFELGAKYEAKGLKPADALIAAYTEWVGADALVTENRHFLSRQSDLPFKVLTAEKCLKLISPSP